MHKLLVLLVSSFIAIVSAPAHSDDRMEPQNADHRAPLRPVYGIDQHIADNTVILTQPWRGRTSWENRELAVYFKANGMADSKLWANVPWTIRGNELCLKSASIDSCYLAYSDATGQAFMRHKGTKLLVSVEGIEVGDSRGVAAAHRQLQAKRKASLKRQQAQARASMAMLGFFAAAMMSGGGASIPSSNEPVRTYRNNAAGFKQYE